MGCLKPPDTTLSGHCRSPGQVSSREGPALSLRPGESATLAAVKQGGTNPSLSPHAVQIWEGGAVKELPWGPLSLRQGTPAGEGKAFPSTAAVI